MDVVTLYPSILIKDGVEAVLEKLNEPEEEIDTGGLSRDEIESLLSLVLQDNFFKFGEKVCRQKEGVAMGNHLVPPFTILFMDKLETKMLETAARKTSILRPLHRRLLGGMDAWTCASARVHCQLQ